MAKEPSLIAVVDIACYAEITPRPRVSCLAICFGKRMVGKYMYVGGIGQLAIKKHNIHLDGRPPRSCSQGKGMGGEV